MNVRGLLVAACATTCAVGAAAQSSSLTVFGKIDSGYVDPIGSRTTKGIRGLGEGAQSRVGFRGSEKLGDKLQAFFWLEHRFRSDTGAQTATRFYQGQSIVGLRGPWGSLSMGRDYVAGYVEVMLAPDPFIHTGVASMVSVATGNVGTVRNDGAVMYKLDAGKVNFQITRGDDSNPNSTAIPAPATRDAPIGLSIAYRDDGWSAGYSFENPGNANDHWHFLSGKAKFGPVTLSAGTGRGQTSALEKRQSYMVGASMVAGSGLFKVAYGNLKNKTQGVDILRKVAIGYNHNLTRRTFLYANFARDRMATADKNGFDMGVQHNF